MLLRLHYIVITKYKKEKGENNLKNRRRREAVLKKIEVTKNENMRLDKWIPHEWEELSRNRLQKLMEEKKVYLNGKQAKASEKVRLGDVIEIEEVPIKKTSLKAQDIPLEIMYEDKDIIVVNKKKGMVVHPANGNPDGTLVNAIMNICKDSLSGIGGELRPGIVHRIDKDTSRANHCC